MLTQVRIRRFKRFNDVSFELGKTVVFVGPNDSGKTSALQALALWHLGLRTWLAKRGSQPSPEKRSGVAINRRDLLAVPIPEINLLWRDRRVRKGERDQDKPRTVNILIDIVVEGITDGNPWECGLEFDFANDESLYCRPLRLPDGSNGGRMLVPEGAGRVNVAFLPPMSGLAAIEPKFERGRIDVLIGEGQTAQVLRNLCFQVFQDSALLEDRERADWPKLEQWIRHLFGVTLNPPEYIAARGEITLSYRDLSDNALDISASGRGCQQTLLLLAYLYAHPRSTLLLDEPDAHLEILRQRQIYSVINEIAESQGSQIIAASHSEVILNEAADRDMVVAFVGTPHRIDDRGSQVLKSLREIGFDQYYLAEQRGWVLYLEGSTDLEILKAFATLLEHPALEHLENPFLHSVANQPKRARSHFYGLREAKPDLVGVALFDRLDASLELGEALHELSWNRREIENYLCQESVLLAYARHDLPDDLFGLAEATHREQVMRESIREVTTALETLNRPGPWSPDVKATDDFLDPVFRLFFLKLKLPNLMQKTDYHRLCRFLNPDSLDSEVREKLDSIAQVARSANPANMP